MDPTGNQDQTAESITPGQVEEANENQQRSRRIQIAFVIIGLVVVLAIVAIIFFILPLL